MRRGTFVRVAIFLLPDPIMSTPDLYSLSLLSNLSGIVEGWLCEDVLVEGRLCVAVRHWRGQTCRGRLKSTPITMINHQYVLTEKRLYQVLRIPPPDRETFR
jgi:hypothetical protein